MSDLRKAAEMALEVLSHSLGHSNEAQQQIDKTKQALRQALAQPEQEPVGWMYVNKDGECEQIEYGPIPFWDEVITLLYATPQKREWVGLTEEEFFNLLSFDGRLDHVETPLIADFIRAIQAKLKEKNA